jgi:hypothetical protein
VRRLDVIGPEALKLRSQVIDAKEQYIGMFLLPLKRGKKKGETKNNDR